jgi:hypothetical protein
MLINKNAVNNTYTVEVRIPTGTTSLQFFFPDVPYLRDKLITGLVASTSLYGVSTGLINLCPAAGGENMFITLATSNGDQFVQNIPVTELQNNLGGSANIVNTNGIWGIAPRNIVWTKSFIFFPIGGFTTNTVAQFNIFYNV